MTNIFSYKAFLLIFGSLNLIFGINPKSTFAQQIDSVNHVKAKRLRTVVVGSTIAYSASLAGLSHLWYKNSEQQSFRFFNDNPEWKQMDKFGHIFSSFYLSYGASKALQWCHVSDTKSDLIGAITGFSILLPIEILDGFSNAYGASPGDLLANAAGASLYLMQKRLWNDVRVAPKFSFRSSKYSSLRPEILGRGTAEEILKDYNGQTYWLSIDVEKFIKFPNWLNVAVGYGANGMIYARDEQNINAGYERAYRQYYLSLDFDWMAIRTRSKVLKTLFFVINTVKLPSPTLEISRKGAKTYAFYF